MVSVNYLNYESMNQLSGCNRLQSAPSSLKNNENDNKSDVRERGTDLPSFKAGALASPVTVRTELTTKEEKEKYKELSSALDAKYKKKLEYALKSGILLKNDSIDKSTVLDNLY
ncbi:hypothetical protein IJO12_00435, partial [bacterium]|nr:hypothetical protein [bacterium]